MDDDRKKESVPGKTVMSGEIVLSGESTLTVKTWREVRRRDDSDIGKGAAVRNLLCAKAREIAGQYETKNALCEYLSNWLKSQSHVLPGDPLPAEDLHMDPHRIGRLITDIWRETHPE